MFDKADIRIVWRVEVAREICEVAACGSRTVLTLRIFPLPEIAAPPRLPLSPSIMSPDLTPTHSKDPVCLIE